MASKKEPKERRVLWMPVRLWSRLLGIRDEKGPSVTITATLIYLVELGIAAHYLAVVARAKKVAANG